MRAYEFLTEKEMDKFGEEVRVTLILTEAELAAVDGITPMTQEIFSSCFEKSIEIGAKRFSERLMMTFKEYSVKYADDLEEMCKGIEVSGHSCDEDRMILEGIIDKAAK